MFVQGSQPGGSKGSADSNEHVDISDEPGHILFAVHVVHQKRGNDIDAGNTEDIEGAVHDDRALGNAEKGQSHSRSIVAQRINTIMDADKIVVLDEGRVAGIGTHQELLKNCQVYQEIASSQLSEEELGKGGKQQ